MRKQKTFFELYDKLKLQAINELMKELQEQHQWKMLAQLKQIKEDFMCSKMNLEAQ